MEISIYNLLYVPSKINRHDYQFLMIHNTHRYECFWLQNIITLTTIHIAIYNALQSTFIIKSDIDYKI